MTDETIARFEEWSQEWYCGKCKAQHSETDEDVRGKERKCDYCGALNKFLE